MKSERTWTEVAPVLSPVDKTVTNVGVDNWNQVLAESMGFPEIIPNKETDKSFYIAVGMNSHGDIVGAKLLSKNPVDMDSPADPWFEERHLEMLEAKSKRIFGLKNKA